MKRGGPMTGDLPWGWWLRVNGGLIEDEEGRTWQSVRDAFWQGRLNFPAIHVAPEQHELLLRVLVAIDGHWLNTRERQHDLFESNMLFWRFYQCWLVSIGLLETADQFGRPLDALSAPLSADGRSVLLMLQVTRDPEWENLPMAEVIDAVAVGFLGPADEARELAMKAFERAIGVRRHVFAREEVGRSHLITCTATVAGDGVRMPVRRVVWSQSFDDAVSRDDLFAWLAVRIGRWDDWGGLAYGNGAEFLTKHLFAQYVASGRTHG